MCGAASSGGASFAATAGRSPRVRGSHHPRGRRSARAGSIPACAGQPGAAPSRAAQLWVDPRVCGAAAHAGRGERQPVGRSPRVRGSRRWSKRAALCNGSIPACAGQPTARWRCAGSAEVDPRVCGAAAVRLLSVLAGVGRSPRVRGSPMGARGLCRAWGSIPACAGQPPRHSRASINARVDPRVCGAAAPMPANRNRELGRSPRVRGSRCAGRRARAELGSIPACAGQPNSPRDIGNVREVDPRVCGAATAAARE